MLAANPNLGRDAFSERFHVDQVSVAKRTVAGGSTAKIGQVAQLRSSTESLVSAEGFTNAKRSVEASPRPQFSSTDKLNRLTAELQHQKESQAALSQQHGVLGEGRKDMMRRLEVALGCLEGHARDFVGHPPPMHPVKEDEPSNALTEVTRDLEGTRENNSASLPAVDHGILPHADHGILPPVDHGILPTADHGLLPTVDHGMPIPTNEVYREHTTVTALDQDAQTRDIEKHLTHIREIEERAALSLSRVDIARTPPVFTIYNSPPLGTSTNLRKSPNEGEVSQQAIHASEVPVGSSRDMLPLVTSTVCGMPDTVYLERRVHSTAVGPHALATLGDDHKERLREFTRSCEVERKLQRDRMTDMECRESSLLQDLTLERKDKERYKQEVDFLMTEVKRLSAAKDSNEGKMLRQLDSALKDAQADFKLKTQEVMDQQTELEQVQRDLRRQRERAAVQHAELNHERMEELHQEEMRTEFFKSQAQQLREVLQTKSTSDTETVTNLEWKLKAQQVALAHYEHKEQAFEIERAEYQQQLQATVAIDDRTRDFDAPQSNELRDLMSDLQAEKDKNYTYEEENRQALYELRDCKEKKDSLQLLVNRLRSELEAQKESLISKERCLDLEMRKAVRTQVEEQRQELEKTRADGLRCLQDQLVQAQMDLREEVARNKGRGEDHAMAKRDLLREKDRATLHEFEARVTAAELAQEKEIVLERENEINRLRLELQEHDRFVDDHEQAKNEIAHQHRTRELEMADNDRKMEELTNMIEQLKEEIGVQKNYGNEQEESIHSLENSLEEAIMKENELRLRIDNLEQDKIDLSVQQLGMENYAVAINKLEAALEQAHRETERERELCIKHHEDSQRFRAALTNEMERSDAEARVGSDKLAGENDKLKAEAKAEKEKVAGLQKLCAELERQAQTRTELDKQLQYHDEHRTGLLRRLELELAEVQKQLAGERQQAVKLQQMLSDAQDELETVQKGGSVVRKREFELDWLKVGSTRSYEEIDRLHEDLTLSSANLQTQDSLRVEIAGQGERCLALERSRSELDQTVHRLEAALKRAYADIKHEQEQCALYQAELQKAKAEVLQEKVKTAERGVQLDQHAELLSTMKCALEKAEADLAPLKIDLENARKKVKERELDSVAYTHSKLEIEKLGIELSGQKEKRSDLEKLCTELELELAKRQKQERGEQSHVKFDLPPTDDNILALTAKESEEVESGIQQLYSIIQKLSQVIVYAAAQCENTGVDSPTDIPVDGEDGIQSHNNVAMVESDKIALKAGLEELERERNMIAVDRAMLEAEKRAFKRNSGSEIDILGIHAASSMEGNGCIGMDEMSNVEGYVGQLQSLLNKGDGEQLQQVVNKLAASVRNMRQHILGSETPVGSVSQCLLQLFLQMMKERWQRTGARGTFNSTALLKMVDAGGLGCISRSEFLHAVLAHGVGISSNCVGQIFDVITSNGGALTLHHFDQLFRDMPVEATA